MTVESTFLYIAHGVVVVVVVVLVVVVVVVVVVHHTSTLLPGLIPGDIVLGINGREIRSTEEVHDLVQSESKLNLTVLRNQRVEYFNVYPETIQVN